MATAKPITMGRATPNGPGSMYKLIAIICSSVLSLPPRLAAITPRRMTANRSTVMPTSRTRITAVTHQDSSCMADRVIRAAPVSALSAIGSAILPKSVTRPRWRASRPSRKSVAEATQNSTNAATRQPVVPAARQRTNAGTSTMRMTVSTLATLTRPGASRGESTPGGPWASWAAPGGPSGFGDAPGEVNADPPASEPWRAVQGLAPGRLERPRRSGWRSGRRRPS